MEAIFAPSSADQSISPYKQMKNPRKKGTRGLISCRSIENMAPMNNNNIHGGLLLGPCAPPALYRSYPPSLSIYNNPRQQQQNHPPLLPLPISKPHKSLPSRTRDLSCPPITRKTNRSRDNSLTPKKPKQPTKREEPKQEISKAVEISAQSLIIACTGPLGPNPNDLPKDVSKVLTSSSSSVAGNDISTLIPIKDFERFSGSVFTLSPPPSSLPLPKFSMRPRLGCNAEAAGVDAGATDNLRRLLRLR